MLFVEGSSETLLFRHSFDYVFGVRNFEITKSVRVIFFLEMFENSTRFQKCSKKLRKKFFCLWDNCIWIGIVNLSLLRRGYFSLAGNVLTSRRKIWNVNSRDFSNWHDLEVITECYKGAVMEISTVLPHVYHVASRCVLWNVIF